nr:glutamate racemase [Noviherbaspirillum cavernae]
METDAAIGVFDSGIGGLSVLRHIHAALPREHLLYFADSGFAPYGDKPEDVVAARTMAVAAFLMQFRIKALVVACNTATAATIKALREIYPALPLIGVEPGLKPAAALTATRTVGVLATEGTLASAKFKLLREQIAAATDVRFLAQPCIGLADQVELGELRSARTAALIRRYIEPLLEQGADTLVLGCTHYPFVQPLIEDVLGRISTWPVTIVDTGEPVTRQLVRLLEQQNLRKTGETGAVVSAFTTGSETALARAFSTLLNLKPKITGIKAPA